MASIRDRFHGAMAGVVVGDALGFPLEGARTVPGRYLEETVPALRRLDYSDDTALTIALAESLVQCGGLDGMDMAQRFAATWAHAPDRGYGGNVVKVFRSVLSGVDWKEAAGSQFGGAGSYGNGGAMRVTPAALWAYPDLEETARLAAETATVTHTHPVGIEGAVIQAVAVHYALSDEFQPARLLADLDERIETDGFRAKLGELESCLENGDDDQARRRLGNSVAADGSVMTAIYCFLVGSGFEETIRRALAMGGDTDTIAAMAGALAGARYGLAAIPSDWRRVEGFDQMATLGEMLYRRTDL